MTMAIDKYLKAEVHFSVGNKTSLGVMASWIASPIGLVVKQQIFSKNKLHVSVGSILGSSGYINQGQTYGGLHWGTITIGDRTSNISFSAIKIIESNIKLAFFPIGAIPETPITVASCWFL